MFACFEAHSEESSKMAETQVVQFRQEGDNAITLRVVRCDSVRLLGCEGACAEYGVSNWAAPVMEGRRFSVQTLRKKLHCVAAALSVCRLLGPAAANRKYRQPGVGRKYQFCGHCCYVALRRNS